MSDVHSPLLFNVDALTTDLQNSTPTLKSRGQGANITLYATVGHSTCFIFHYEFIILLRYKSLCVAPFEDKPRIFQKICTHHVRSRCDRSGTMHKQTSTPPCAALLCVCSPPRHKLSGSTLFFSTSAHSSSMCVLGANKRAQET